MMKDVTGYIKRDTPNREFITHLAMAEVDIFDNSDVESELDDDVDSGLLETELDDDSDLSQSEPEIDDVEDTIHKAWKKFRNEITNPTQEERLKLIEKLKVEHPQVYEHDIKEHIKDDCLPQFLDDAADKLKGIIGFYEVLEHDPLVKKIIRVRDRIVEEGIGNPEEALEEAINSYRKKLKFIFDCK